MGNLFGRNEEPAMAEHSGAPSTSVQKCQPTPRNEPSASSSDSCTASSSAGDISEPDEHSKWAMVDSWLTDVVRAREAVMAKKERWRSEGRSTPGEEDSSTGGSVCTPRERITGTCLDSGTGARKTVGRNIQERGSTVSMQRCARVGDGKGLRGKPDDCRCGCVGPTPESVTPMKDNRVYVVDMKRTDGRNTDTSKGFSVNGRADEGGQHFSPAEIEEITEQEYRRRVGTESRYSAGKNLTKPCPGRQVASSPKTPLGTGSPSRVPANFSRARSVRQKSAASKRPLLEASRRGDQPLKATTSCADSTKCPHWERLEFVANEPEKLMNRENRPVGDCVPDCRETVTQAKPMRSYEYRRDFPSRNGEWNQLLEAGECQGPTGCKHCSSKMSVLRC